MLPKEARLKPYPSRELFHHLNDIRGRKYFPHCSTAKERYKECEQAIVDPMKGAIVPDKRLDKNSTHVCLFVNGNGQNIALPLAVQEDGKIGILTIKNIAESKQKPDWFYNEYSKVAKMRGMPEMDRIWRPEYEKD